MDGLNQCYFACDQCLEDQRAEHKPTQEEIAAMTKEFRRQHMEEIKNQQTANTQFCNQYEPKVYKVTYS